MLLRIARGVKMSLLRQNQAALPVPLYNTMVAAFGRCGDIETAFSIIDEMSKKGVRIDCQTYDHLLHACITDKESGFRLALVIYRRLLNNRLAPRIETFNLLLRATKDCGIGHTEVANDLLVEAMSSKEVRKFKQKLLEEQDDKTVDTPHETDIQFVTQNSELLQAKPVAPQLPNFLSKQPVMDFITGLSASQLNTSLNARLQLFGDIDGFIDVVVNEFKVDIDIKTLSLLLSFANSVESEDKILTRMNNLKVKPDIDFFNQLMRQKIARFDHKGIF